MMIDKFYILGTEIIENKIVTNDSFILVYVICAVVISFLISYIISRIYFKKSKSDIFVALSNENLIFTIGGLVLAVISALTAIPLTKYDIVTETYHYIYTTDENYNDQIYEDYDVIKEINQNFYYVKERNNENEVY